MSNIIPFEFENMAVRVIPDEAGEPWFVAADVCRILELANPSQAIRVLDPDERGLRNVETPSAPQEMAVISEPGLYKLMGRSRKPEARRFDRWVRHEVLPSIRKTGSYGAPDPMKLLNDPAAMRGLLLTYTEKVLALESAVTEERARADQAEKTVEVIKPKAEFHDAVTEAVNCQTVQEIAKVLGTGQNRLFSMLRDHGLLMHDNQPYQKYIEAGYFRTVEKEYKDKRGERHTYVQTLVTGKGLSYIQRKLFGSSGQSRLF
jgi:anti-repressor protein